MGYFKSIAKQSGLKIGKARPGRGDDGAALFSQARSQHRRPSDERIGQHDDVVMIDQVRSDRTESPTESRFSSDQKTANRESREVSDYSPAPVVSERLEPAEKSRETIVRPDHLIEPASSNTPPPGVLEPAAPDFDLEPAPTVRNVSRIEPSGESVPEISVEQIRTATEPANSQIDQQETSIEPAPREFFVRTTEILEGKPAPPAEATTILLRELQEWIADGAQETAGQPDVDEKRMTEIASEAEPPPERAGIIRIGETRARERETESPTVDARQEPISEETFELSIGSITVTVDGDQARPPNAAPPRPIQPGREKGVTRKSNGLGRHYL